VLWVMRVKKKIVVEVTGNTYTFKDDLKRLGFRFNFENRKWFVVKDTIDEVLDLAEKAFDMLPVKEIIFGVNSLADEEKIYVEDDRGRVLPVTSLAWKSKGVVIETPLKAAFIPDDGSQLRWYA